MEAENLKGVIAAIATPFDNEGLLDVKGVATLTRYVLDGGCHAIMTCGGTGEFPHLSREEKRAVTENVAKVAKGKACVIAGTAACGTMEAIQLCHDAKLGGADAVILVPPYYFRLPDESIYAHFEAVAGSAGLPVVIYNNPLYTGNNMSPELIARISNIPGIIGLKQSNPDLGQLVEVLRTSRKGFSILTGIDSQFYPALCVGAVGIFSTAACVAPRMMVEIYDAFLQGDHKRALATHMNLQILNRFLEYDPGYVAPCKEALRMMGLPGGPVRAPLPSLTSAQRNDLKDALKQLELLSVAAAREH
ncbi:MAG TPA: 4-hydroxy-tetrahydrodipicolinate synthase [Terriglobales bacterium]|nr:4-hydroxy-tetrahydrodipicolinate synthase [Terriglobales bacterium]